MRCSCSRRWPSIRVPTGNMGALCARHDVALSGVRVDAGLNPLGALGAVRFLAARIPLDVDVYTIYPTHNFTGPNTHFLATFGALERVAALGLEARAVAQREREARHALDEPVGLGHQSARYSGDGGPELLLRGTSPNGLGKAPF